MTQKTNAMLAIAMLIAGLACRSAKGPIDVITIEKQLRAYLPIGTSKSNVIAYLDQQKIPHSWLQSAQFPTDKKVVIPNSHKEIALIRDVRTRGMVQTSVQIVFTFDDADSNLVDYSVKEVYTGP